MVRLQLHVLLMQLGLFTSVFQTGDMCYGSNFMSYSAIKNKSPFCFDDPPNTVKPIGKGLYLMPHMNFTCSGKIKNILVGARIDSQIKDNSRPQLQIWRPVSCAEKSCLINPQNFVTLVSSHSIDISGKFYSTDAHFYYNFPEPIDFNAGDFIGFYQPSDESNVRMFYSTETYMPKQFVYVDNSSNVNNEIHVTSNISYALDSLHSTEELYMLFRPSINAELSCLNGFLDFGEVKTRSQFINPLKYNHKQLRLFPDIRFDCPLGKGYITEITFGAQTREYSDNNALLPELQIWRRMNSNQNSYIKVHSIPLIKNESEISNVHEIHLNPPVEFMNRDTIGLFQPDVDKSQLVVFYQETSGPRNLLVANNIDEPSPTAVASLDETSGNDYPLVTVNIVLLSSDTTKSSMDTYSTEYAVASESPTTLSTQSTVPTGSNKLIIIIAAIIGVSVLAILILIVSILSAIMCYKVKQQKKKDAQIQQTTNTSSVAAVPNSPDTKTPRAAKDLTMSHNYEECVKMENNFSYGVISPRDLMLAVNPSYNINGRSVGGDASRDSYTSISSSHYEEYVLPLPYLSPIDSRSHIYY